jgi:membrane associated rhomboid family serine protease
MARAPQRTTRPGSFGGLTIGKMPPVIMVYIVVTLAASIAAVVGARNGVGIAEWCALIPSAVLRGQAWRLFTWIFFEVQHPMNLVFACLSYYWFGSDLAYRWGAARFVAYTLGLAALVGGLTCTVAVLAPDVVASAYLTSWPLQDAIIILWATYFPSRQMRLYMVLPVNGRALITITVLGTVLYSLYAGFAAFVPHFLAEGIALVALRLPSPRTWWIERKLRGMEQRRQKSHLRVVPRDAEIGDDDKPEPPGGRWLN